MISLRKLIVKLVGDTGDFDKNLKQSGEKLADFGTKVAAIGSVGASLTGLLTGPVLLAAASEKTNAVLKNMAGNARDVAKTFSTISSFTVKSPFNLAAVKDAAKSLLIVNEEAGSLKSTLNTLGDVASGSGRSLQEITDHYVQIKTAGKVTQAELEQMALKGVVSLKDIADHFGKTEQEASEMVSKGKVSFGEFKKILGDLAGEGGRFAGSMEEEIGMLFSLLNRIKENIKDITKEVGSVWLPVVKQVASWVEKLTAFVRDMDPVFKQAVGGIIGVVGALGFLATGLGMAGKVVGNLAASWFDMANVILPILGVRFTQATASIRLYTAAIGGAKVATLGLFKILAVGVGSFLIGQRIAKEIPYIKNKMKEIEGIIGGSVLVTNAWVKRQNKNFEEFDQHIESLSGKNKEIALNKELKNLGGTLKNIHNSLGKTQEQIDGMPKWQFWKKGDRRSLEQDLENQERMLIIIKQRYEELGGVTENIELPGSPTPEDLAAAQELSNMLLFQLETIGLSAIATEQLALQRKHIPLHLREQIKQQRESLDLKQKKIDADKKIEAAAETNREAMKQFRLEMEEGIKTIGMSADAIRIWRFDQSGDFTDPQIAELRELSSLKKEGLEIEKQLRKLEQDGKDLAKSVMTDEEKLFETTKKIHELHQSNAISDTTFSRAIEKAKKEYNQAKQAALEFKGVIDEIMNMGGDQFHIDMVGITDPSKSSVRQMTASTADQISRDAEKQAEKEVTKRIDRTNRLMRANTRAIKESTFKINVLTTFN